MKSNCSKIISFAKEDFGDYIAEYGPCGRAARQLLADGRMESRIAAIVGICRQNAVVLFSKPGCGYCVRALTLLREHLPPHGEVHEVPSNDALSKAALKRTFGISTITFPMIVIEGEYYGGNDDIEVFLRNEQLSLATSNYGTDSALHGASVIPHSALLRARDARPQLLRTPRGRSVCTFHFDVYSNVMRSISVLHIAAFVTSLYAPFAVTQSIIRVVCVDLALFVLLGSNPWAPLQTGLLYAGWKMRGPSATSIPYKAVFAFYIVELCRNVVFCSDEKTCAKPVHFWGLIINSSLLAVLRF